jgi:Cd2+/Zn2+-exporting ATPase
MTAQTLESRYRVTGMDCASCGRKIDTAIRRLPGVEDVSVAVQTGVLKIRHGGDLADEAVLQQLRNLGYSGEAAAPTSGAVAAAAGPPPAAARAGGAPWWWTGKARLTALCGLALLSA